MNSCYLCQSPEYAVTPFFYEHLGRQVRIVRCRSCGLGRLHPMLSEEEVMRFYDAAYFQRDYRCGLAHKPYEEEIESLRREARPMLSVIRKLAAGNRLLEIGCAGGAMLAEARSQGFAVVGAEVSPEMAQWGRDHLQLDIRTGTLEQQKFSDEQFDVVFLGDVIEHLLNPLEVLKEIRRVLSPRGIVALAYPMELNGIIPRIRSALNIRRQSSEKPYHLYYYSLQTMNMLLGKSGFAVVYAQERKLLRGDTIRTMVTDSLNLAVTALTGKAGDRGFTVGTKTHSGEGMA